jgi:hypothetical protein
MMTQSVIAATVANRSGWPVRQLPHRRGDDCLLPLFGNDTDLDLAVLDVEDGMSRDASPLIDSPCVLLATI